MLTSLRLATNLFPAWVLLAGLIALIHPAAFTWFRGPAIVWGLAVIMLGMGLTLTVEDFARVLRMPVPVAIGVTAQYLIMPTLGWTIAYLLDLPRDFAVGLILVSCCPGGTASNVVTYLARANTALSVLMTMVSTFAAIVMTPLLTKLLVGTLITIDAWALFRSTVQVVLIPVFAGVAMRRIFGHRIDCVLPVSPLIAVLTIALICGSVIAQNAEALKAHGDSLILAVFLLHVGGFSIGYLFALCLGYGPQVRRTVSIEVGMQNSGLGVVLAQRHFPATLAPVPCAISAVMHSVIGSVLAGLWRLEAPANREPSATTIKDTATP